MRALAGRASDGTGRTCTHGGELPINVGEDWSVAQTMMVGESAVRRREYTSG